MNEYLPKSVYLYAWYGDDEVFTRLGLRTGKAYPERYLNKIVAKLLTVCDVMILKIGDSYNICTAPFGTRFKQK